MSGIFTRGPGAPTCYQQPEIQIESSISLPPPGPMTFTWAQLTYHCAVLRTHDGIMCSIRSRYVPGGVVKGTVKFTLTKFSLVAIHTNPVISLTSVFPYVAHAVSFVGPMYAILNQSPSPMSCSRSSVRCMYTWAGPWCPILSNPDYTHQYHRGSNPRDLGFLASMFLAMRKPTSVPAWMVAVRVLFPAFSASRPHRIATASSFFFVKSAVSSTVLGNWSPGG